MYKKLFYLTVFVFVGFLAFLYLSKTPKQIAPRPLVEPPTKTTQDKQMIIVEFPQPNQVVTSPLVVKGKARGGWFFEGDFPVTLYWGMGDEFVETYATAQGEWMTDDFVNFTVTIEFPKPYAKEGMLVLKKSNPSDIKELNDEIVIPVNFW